jgi:hypothetical protein
MELGVDLYSEDKEMIRMIKYLLFCSLFGLFGCKSDKVNYDTKLDVEKSNKTSILIVGMEFSKTFGECAGSGVDAERMYGVLKNYSDNIVKLRDGEATISRFTKELSNIVTNELAILYYSGHGGSQVIGDNLTKLEADGTDEFLCLSDGAYRDDSIWNIISKAKGRVLLIFDCCHSQTMFRHPIIKLDTYARRRDSVVNMLCWSGCPDNTYSYGSKDGGEFTNAILYYLNPKSSYRDTWYKLSTDSVLKRFETIQQTKMGTFDVELKVFQ